MSQEQKIIINQQGVDRLNWWADVLRWALSETLGNDPSSLPDVLFVDDQETRDALKNRQPNEVPAVFDTSSLDLEGVELTAVDSVRLHPDYIALLAQQKIESSGSLKEAISAYMETGHPLLASEANQQNTLVFHLATPFITRLTLVDNPEVDLENIWDIGGQALKLALRFFKESR